MGKFSRVPVFILAGGLGTRLSEETQVRPKPMVEIGELPILLHVMRSYYADGFDDFVICAGYRSWDIKSFFVHYHQRMNHLEIDHRTDEHRAPIPMGKSPNQERWRVRVVDTGVDCMTGARLARAFDAAYEADDFPHFAVTYGDGLSDVVLGQEFDYHLSHQKIGTVLGVTQPQRYGVLDIDSQMKVKGFLEKPESRSETINGGFFFFKNDFRKYLSTNSDCVLEREPLARLAQDGELMTFKHTGFWQSMDTLRDKRYLDELWQSKKAPWLKPS